MPRWPEKDKEEKTEVHIVLDGKEITEHMHLPVASVDPSDTNMLVRSLSERVDDLNIAFTRLSDKLTGLSALELAFKPPVADPDAPAYQIQRRRDETELRRALKLLASGQLRPRDDDSEQIISDAFGELFAMRQLNYDLMQMLTSGYQNGLAAIRKLTER